MVVAFIFLQLLDIWTTWYALEKVPGAYEKNPLVQWVMDRLGIVLGLVALKLPMIVAVLILPIHWSGIAVLVVMYLVVVINNLHNIIK